MALTVCIFNDHLIFQIYIMAAQILVQVTVVGSKVFLTRAKSRLEYFNEFILMMVLYTIFTFSPWVDDVNVVFYIGYITISIVALHLLVNLFLIFAVTFGSFKWKCKRSFVKKKHDK